eukprot:CCRYP_015102-RA/>CCRYP_015102-RA protein AED:0.05 eAED:0.05 QI:53/1/1/1/1/1/3/627/445
MMNLATRSGHRPVNQGILASVILLAMLALLTFFLISSESSEFQSRSKYETSIYGTVVKNIYPEISESIEFDLELRRGVEGLYQSEDDDDDATSGYGSIDDFEAAFEEAFKVSDMEQRAVEDPWHPRKISPEHIKQILSSETSRNAELLTSPACKPHFQLALPSGQFSNVTKFKRIYLYHARKAGGSSMSLYFSTVAKKYGLDYKAREWGAMEEPGFGDSDTFYVAHVREPVDRAISHFKYQGRWHCKNLTGNKAFIATEENANKLETWAETGGHVPFECKTRNEEERFWLGNCAVNCYTQWFSGLSCPKWNISQNEQYAVAKRRVLRYNLIVVVERLRDPLYVEAIEQMFGVPGITIKGVPYCERQSHKANTNNPLVIRNETRERLKKLNALDIRFYDELSSCLRNVSTYNFPKWDPGRFETNSYNWTEASILAKAAKERKKASQ